MSSNGQSLALPENQLQKNAAATITTFAPAPQDCLVSVSNLGKCYRMYAKPHHRLLEAVFRSRKYYQDFWALRHVNIHVAKGETIGILGQNGSGKSTFLQIAAGTLAPSEGTVHVNGRVAALLELGSGFNPEFTGRENVYLNGSILGLSREQMDERFAAIASFAEIGDFIDRPVKTYSSGMQVRLAFSVAISVSPEILIVDEALSVGDARFQQRCMTRIREMRDSGVSILFVTHDTEACKRLCQRVYVLDKGTIIGSGPADEMANWYLAFLTSLDGSIVKMSTKQADSENRVLTNESSTDSGDDNVSKSQLSKEFAWLRHGDGNGVIESCEILDSSAQPANMAFIDESYIVRFKLLFNVASETAVLGFYLKDRLGTDVIGINTHEERVPIPPVQPGARVTVDFKFPMIVRSGYYSVSPGFSYDRHGSKFYDYIHHALIFKVVDRDTGRNVHGLIHPPVQVKVTTQ